MKTLKDFQQPIFCIMDNDGTIEEMTRQAYLEKYFSDYGFPTKGNGTKLMIFPGNDIVCSNIFQVGIYKPGTGFLKPWCEAHNNKEHAVIEMLEAYSDCERKNDGSTNAPAYFNTLLEAREWALMNLLTFSLKKYGDGNWRWYHPADCDKHIFIHIDELKDKDADWFIATIENIKECQS